MVEEHEEATGHSITDLSTLTRTEETEAETEVEVEVEGEEDSESERSDCVCEFDRGGILGRTSG